MNVLYVGSGHSANLVSQLDLTKYTICCANNSWRLFEDGVDVCAWIHSGDFPTPNRPSKDRKEKYQYEVSHNDYDSSMRNICEKMGYEPKSPMHHLGYTVFFAGLYWIADTLKPKKVSLLGFDHDYDSDKTKKWMEAGQPSPQNIWKEQKSYNQNVEEFFEGTKTDHFYGQGTPDPMRIGEKVLIEKFELAKATFLKLNIELVNISPLDSKINTVKREIGDYLNYES